MKYRVQKFVTVWTAKRGVLPSPEPLSERNNLLANVSLLCRQLEAQKRLLRDFDRLCSPPRKPAAAVAKKPPKSAGRKRAA
jgi:hypothetical protein